MREREREPRPTDDGPRGGDTQQRPRRETGGEDGAAEVEMSRGACAVVGGGGVGACGRASSRGCARRSESEIGEGCVCAGVLSRARVVGAAVGGRELRAGYVYRIVRSARQYGMYAV